MLAEDSKIFISVSQSPTQEILNPTYKQINILIPMVQEGKLDEAIFTIQNKIREIIVDGIEKKSMPNIVLYGQGFDAGLLSIAQTNLLPEYRQYIRGLILEDARVNLPLKCKPKEDAAPCQILQRFKERVGSRASFIEMSKALSPQVQIDWYWPPVLLMGSQDQKEWKALLEENGIGYQLVNFERLHPKKVALAKVDAIQTFLATVKKPSVLLSSSDMPKHFGALLRFHLGKIVYRSKERLSMVKNVTYGSDVQQQYDVYFKEHSKNNPLFIYIHGGGWSQGEKSSFEDLCKQYADKGYTAVAIEYRLLQLPQVGMKEMVSDVKLALDHVLLNAKAYHANGNQTIVMAESAGAQLAFMGIKSLSKTTQGQIKGVVFNSITADLREHPKKKQIRLSGIELDTLRKIWLDEYSPLIQLDNFYVPIFALHSLTDYVVPAVHLDKLLFQAKQEKRTITPLWISNGVHPIAPDKKSLEPSYQDIERKIDIFIKKHLKIETIIKQ
ncbi:alpha/beta hydrolase [bacterium]|nr:alpha/beta hydrolase [bacterium]MBU1958842.1 alpha/beta hydrolase [bacterium]